MNFRKNYELQEHYELQQKLLIKVKTMNFRKNYELQ